MNLPEETARKVLTVVGARICKELQGYSCLHLEEIAPAKKEIVCSRSFGHAITDKHEMSEAVAEYAARAAEKLRRQNSVAENLRVFIETNPFKPEQRQYFGSAGVQLETASSFTPDLIQAAGSALKECWRDGFRFKKAGVMLFGIQPASAFQSSFATPEPEVIARRGRAMAALDKLNRFYGRGSVNLAAAGIARPWQMKRERCFLRFTTRWEELPIVIA